MADNATTSLGTGDGITFATDEISTIHFPRVKLIHGADGVNAGDVATGNPLPVVQTGTPGLPTGAATAAKQPALGTAGSASADVITVQGIASGTAIAVSVASLPSHAVTNAGTFAVQQAAIATGGATPGKLICANTTNATSVKASAGTLYTVIATNLNAAMRYLKFYNKASAPTVGSDTPVLVIGIPGNTAGAGIVVPIPACGINFGTGIAFAVTTGIADADSTAVAASEIAISYAYI